MGIDRISCFWSFSLGPFALGAEVGYLAGLASTLALWNKEGENLE